LVYRWVDHTAELELAIEAPSVEDVLADALAALAELLEPEVAQQPRPGAASSDAPRRADGAAAAGREQRAVAVCARDRAGLFAAWLEELVFLAESEGFVGETLITCRLGAERLETSVEGRLGAPRPVVKAVTYHRLAFESSGPGYVANVVLDV
jgi:SHS2 domain-containing protein